MSNNHFRHNNITKQLVRVTVHKLCILLLLHDKHCYRTTEQTKLYFWYHLKTCVLTQRIISHYSKVPSNKGIMPCHALKPQSTTQ